MRTAALGLALLSGVSVTGTAAQTVPINGYVANENADPKRLAALKKGLTDLGCIEGKTFRIEYRGAGRLLGVCGLNVDPYAGDERVGRVRHLYVLSTCRGRGVGRQLVRRVIVAAQGRFDELRLRTNNPAAARLYEALGFRPSEDGRDYTHLSKLAANPKQTGGHS
jgi:ribosomal protein S18 acetylase RimI-like enzyme